MKYITKPYLDIATLTIIALAFIVALIQQATIHDLSAQIHPLPTLAPVIIVASPTPPAARLESVARRLAPPVAPSPITPTAAPVAPTAAPAAAGSGAAPLPTPADGYIAHTDRGDMVIPADATRVPAGATYTGPFLAPLAPTVAPDAVRYCTGFGDWRDYDPQYASSPVCHH